ncbi:MAG TPA: hypothetical protein PLS94_02460 [Prolixibacteraceae bacterium]|nr:hypothetical protein [Prolixibacteraceae bacterium]
MLKFFLLFLFCWLGLQANAQLAYRLKADILTKTRLVDSTFQVSKGKIFYDMNAKKIVYDFSFPRKEKVVLFDTIMYNYENEKLQNTSTNYLLPEQSIFHFMLTGNLDNFGLYESNFNATKVEKQKDLVVTTWSPPEQLKPLLSKIDIATKKKQIYGITMYNSDGQIINRQILKNYQLVNGLNIPTEVLLATYLTQGTVYQIITLSNVVINEKGNNQIYNHEL